MLLVIDNYDSFTYNLVQYLGELGAQLEVVRNDTLTIADIERMKPERMLISPGPGRPEDAGITQEVIRYFYQKLPILGVCLGHQAIGQVFGAKVVHAPTQMHGKTSPIIHDGKGLFKGIQSPFTAMRYHSLVVDPKSVSDEFELSAHTPEGVLMGMRHKQFPLEGVQFHPESILTEFGKVMLGNFLSST